MSNLTFSEVNEETKQGFMDVIAIVISSDQLFFNERNTKTVNEVLNSETEINHFTKYCIEQFNDSSENSLLNEPALFVRFAKRLHRVSFNLTSSNYLFPLRKRFPQDCKAFKSSSVSNSGTMLSFKKIIPLLSLTCTNNIFHDIDVHYTTDAENKIKGGAISMVRLLQARMRYVQNLRSCFNDNEQTGKFIKKHATEAHTQFVFSTMLNLILKELNKSGEELDPAILFATVGSSFPGKRNKEFAQQTSTDIIVGNKVNNNFAISTFVEIKSFLNFNLELSVQYSINEFIKGRKTTLNSMASFFRALSTYGLVHQSTSGLSTDGELNIAFELRCDLIDETSKKNFNSLDDFIRILMNSQNFRRLVGNRQNRLSHEDELETLIQELRISNIEDENKFEVIRLIKRNLLQQIVLNFDKIDTEIRIKRQGPITLTPKLRSIEKLLGPEFVFLPLDVFNFSSETPIQAVWLTYLFHLRKSKKLRDVELRSLEKLDNVTRLRDENTNPESHPSRDPTYSPSPSPATRNQSRGFSNHSSQAQNDLSLDPFKAKDATYGMEDLTREFLTIKLVDEINLVDYI